MPLTCTLKREGDRGGERGRGGRKTGGKRREGDRGGERERETEGDRKEDRAGEREGDRGGQREGDRGGQRGIARETEGERERGEREKEMVSK